MEPRLHPGRRVIRRAPEPGDRIVQMALGVAGVLAAYHRASIEGIEQLPDGPALLVGNHGLLAVESPVLFYLIHRETGRLPIAMADRVFFGRGPLRALLGLLGGVPGTQDNALALLRAGRLVVSYPGGAREVFKPPERRHQLAWEGADGFARVAARAAVPVVPFAGLGVDDVFVNLGPLRIARRVLGRYAPPLAFGLGPLPLPVRLRFRLGRPVPPPVDEADVPAFKARVRRRVERLLRPELPYVEAAAEPGGSGR